MVNVKQMFVSAVIFAGVLAAGPVLASKLADQSGNADPVGSRSIMSPAKIDARTAPDAKVCIQGEECGSAAAAAPAAATTAAAAPAAAAQSPESIYNASCALCHGMGIAGAPALGDKAAWAPRIAQGDDLLYSHAINGLNAMPPMGTCGSCSQDDIKAVVDYMVSKSQ